MIFVDSSDQPLFVGHPLEDSGKNGGLCGKVEMRSENQVTICVFFFKSVIVLNRQG